MLFILFYFFISFKLIFDDVSDYDDDDIYRYIYIYK